MSFRRADLAWYAGFFIGTSSVYVGLQWAGLEPHLLRLVIAGACGVGMGWLGESSFTPPKDDAGGEGA